MLKEIKTKKKIKTSKEVRELCVEMGVTEGVLKCKDGYAVIRGMRIKKIFVGRDALKNAKADTIEKK